MRLSLIPFGMLTLKRVFIPPEFLTEEAFA
jgi:hypothetical protein